jgi:transcriptional regulator with XRE-family HTH domain
MDSWKKPRIFDIMPRAAVKKPKVPGFPERIRNLRLQKGLSQSELGKLVDIHYNQIGRYELGTAEPTAENINKLAMALGVSADFLYRGEEEGALHTRLEDRELIEMIQQIKSLSEEDQFVVKKLLKAFLRDRKIAEKYD